MRLDCNPCDIDRTAALFGTAPQFRVAKTTSRTSAKRCVYTSEIASAVPKNCHHSAKNLCCRANIFLALVNGVLISLNFS